MYIDVVFSPLELSSRRDLTEKSVAVIDALRATTTISFALWGYDNKSGKPEGCTGVIPVESIDEAFDEYKKHKKETVLLAGERFCLKPEGFDFGNSPDEHTIDNIKDKMIIFSTTNGTKALKKAAKANFITTASFVNADSCAKALLHKKNNIIVLCAGRSEKTTIEDTACAGLMVDILIKKCQNESINFLMSDSATIAKDFYNSNKGNIYDLLLSSEAGKNLIEVNLKKDIAVCSKINTIPMATEYIDGTIKPIPSFSL